jgi:predicted nucleic acid-binding protein
VATYLDSSAIVKLVVQEPESGALRRYLRRRQPLISSALARTEVLRALLPAGDEAVTRGRTVLQRIDLVRVNDRILSAAGVLRPPELRSLDAIHLATAAELGDELSVLVTYDDRMVNAVKQMGYKIVQPR